MGYEAKKTEHCGSQARQRRLLGYKWEAKKESNRIRRENAKREIRGQARAESDSLPTAPSGDYNEKP
jgi:hypothetical protein